ncbi:RHTO0S16e01706g1_1 [Rhodotorula toruloides]|uniref:RHTO0S16e01706g1_1 n=1 Tax=Rhodotorula toruloides TaxID=5286 RepID=A0A061BDV7_RHOTO|nr:RHTO0S16e01706g1_1 [Rhodotorula toruloides]
MQNNSTQIPPEGAQGGHFNQITQRWEMPNERPEIASSQGASTMPDADGNNASGPSFKEQVAGYAKKFAGMTTGKKHEIAMGQTLLEGQGKEQAIADAEFVKQQTKS